MVTVLNFLLHAHKIAHDAQSQGAPFVHIGIVFVQSQGLEGEFLGWNVVQQYSLKYEKLKLQKKMWNATWYYQLIKVSIHSIYSINLKRVDKMYQKFEKSFLK